MVRKRSTSLFRFRGHFCTIRREGVWLWTFATSPVRRPAGWVVRLNPIGLGGWLDQSVQTVGLLIRGPMRFKSYTLREQTSLHRLRQPAMICRVTLRLRLVTPTGFGVTAGKGR